MDDTKRYERLRERFQNGDISPPQLLSAFSPPRVPPTACRFPFCPAGIRQSDVSQVRFDGWGAVRSRSLCRKFAFRLLHREVPASLSLTEPSPAATNIWRWCGPASPRRIQYRPSVGRGSTTPAIIASDLNSELNPSTTPREHDQCHAGAE